MNYFGAKIQIFQTSQHLKNLYFGAKIQIIEFTSLGQVRLDQGGQVRLGQAKNSAFAPVCKMDFRRESFTLYKSKKVDF